MRFLVASILSIFFLAACHSGKKDQPVTVPAKPIPSQQVVSNGVKIAYDKCGTGDTTLLFIHGWCIDRTYWQPQVDYFCPRYTVVTVDLPGFGESGTNREQFTFDAYADDIKTIIETLKLKNVVLIGHSMSGDIVLKADNKFPFLLAGIAGVDNLHEPGSKFDDQRNRENEAFFQVLGNQFDSAVRAFMVDYLFQPSTPSTVRERVLQDIYSFDSTIAINVLRNMTIAGQEEKFLMKGLKHKLYLVNSDVTPVKSDSLSRYCANGFHVEPVAGTGHYPMLEKPALFNEALQRCIDQMGTDK